MRRGAWRSSCVSRKSWKRWDGSPPGWRTQLNTPCQFVGLNAHFLNESFRELEKLLLLYETLAAAVATQPALTPVLTDIAALVESGDIAYLRERTPQAIVSVDEGVHRIAALVSAMKYFAQPDVDGPASIDLNRALESTLTVVHHQARAAGEIERRFAELPTITGSPGDLNQALLGIVLNAIQAIEEQKQRTGQPGRIVVETRMVADGGAVEVAISDNGPGIPEAIRGRIFDPFFTTRAVGSGAGQGLSVARSISSTGTEER